MFTKMNGQSLHYAFVKATIDTKKHLTLAKSVRQNPIMTLINQKDLRIQKLFQRGVTEPERIARKIGLNGAEGVQRVRDGLIRLGLTHNA